MTLTTENIIGISSAIQAIATVVLVCITFSYARQTKRTVDSMDKSMKMDFLPIIMLGISSLRSNEKEIHVNLTNIGNGVAKRPVRIIFPGIAPIYLNSIEVQTTASAIVKYEMDYILQLQEHEKKIVVEYYDVFSRLIKTEACLVKMKYGKNQDVEGLGWETWTPMIP